jgi:hypothetical protein
VTTFTMHWNDIEDPKASLDREANVAFVQASLDVCAGRIRSGLYGNVSTIPRILGTTRQFAQYPFWNADGIGYPEVRPVGFNGLTATYDQYALDVLLNGVAVDIDCRLTDHGTEYGFDLSNYSGVPSSAWFMDRWEEGYRFVVFGTQRPTVALQQVASMEATGLPFDPQLYTYLNFPGGDFYSGLDGAAQVTRALDAMGVPQYVPPPAPPQVTPRSEFDDDMGNLSRLDAGRRIALFEAWAKHDVTDDTIVAESDAPPSPQYRRFVVDIPVAAVTDVAG